MELKTKVIHKYKDCVYCQIATLTYDNIQISDALLIAEIIKSKWFFWEGEEFPNGTTWLYTNENGENEEIQNVKIHGNYNANLLDSSDFQLVSNKQILKNFIQYIRKNIRNSTESEIFITKLNRYIEKQLSNDVICYQLKEVDKRKISKFSVFSLFVSFLTIDKRRKEIILIEFGQD